MKAEQTSPLQSVIKRLFAKSGNRCAFPGCPHEIVHGETIIGQVCHIKAQSPSGPRYDPKQSAADRHDYPNLILFCANHHIIVDDDPDIYTVEALTVIKANHEHRASEVAIAESERAATLLSRVERETDREPPPPVARNVTGANAEGRRQLIAGVKALHADRMALIALNKGAVATLGGALLSMHIFPESAQDGLPSAIFDRLAGNPDLFPPMGDSRPRGAQIDFHGLLTGSNALGLNKPQRAHVEVFRTAVVESVISSLERGRGDDVLVLPHLQALIIKYAFLYTRALAAAGISPAYGIACSLANVQNMRLLHDFIPSGAHIEDLPQGRLRLSSYNFAEAVITTVPETVNDCAKQIRQLVDHLANAAGLPTSPYFDPDGNYELKP